MKRNLIDFLQKPDIFAIPLYFVAFLAYSSNGAISISLYEDVLSITTPLLLCTFGKEAITAVFSE